MPLHLVNMAGELNPGFVQARPIPYQLSHSEAQLYLSPRPPILFYPPRAPLEQRCHCPAGGQGPRGSEKLRILSDLNTCLKAWPQSSGHPTSVYWAFKSGMAKADTDGDKEACGGHPVFMIDTSTGW